MKSLRRDVASPFGRLSVEARIATRQAWSEADVGHLQGDGRSFFRKGWVMVVLRVIGVGMEGEFREVRLRALEESPWAFGATFEREVGMTKGEWAERVRQRDGERAVGYLAFEGEGGGVACGIVGGFLDEGGAKVVHLVSMWVAPTCRRCGVGRMLVEEVVGWAKGRGAERVCLMVTSCNEGAMRFYEGLGFVRTGRVEPYPNDVRWVEWEMVRGVE